MERKQSKPTVEQGSPNNFEIIEAMGLKIIASRSP
jgi:hypothetical protein